MCKAASLKSIPITCQWYFLVQITIRKDSLNYNVWCKSFEVKDLFTMNIYFQLLLIVPENILSLFYCSFQSNYSMLIFIYG